MFWSSDHLATSLCQNTRLEILSHTDVTRRLAPCHSFTVNLSSACRSRVMDTCQLLVRNLTCDLVRHDCDEPSHGAPNSEGSG